MRHHSPAHPCKLTNDTDSEDVTGYEGEDIAPGITSEYSGLTVREHFAGLAMQGLLMQGPNLPEDIAELAVQHADALIANLYPGDFEDEEQPTEHGSDVADANGTEPEWSEPDAEAQALASDQLPLHIPV